MKLELGIVGFGCGLGGLGKVWWLWAYFYGGGLSFGGILSFPRKRLGCIYGYILPRNA